MKVVGPGNIIAVSDRAPLMTKEIMVRTCPWMLRFARHPRQATELSYGTEQDLHVISGLTDRILPCEDQSRTSKNSEYSLETLHRSL
jgi:hypothetical protein